MDIRSKNFSHSLITKVIVFIITIVCFTGAITLFLNIAGLYGGDFDPAFEKDYYLSKDFMQESSQIAQTLKNLTEFKGEEQILNGETITEEEIGRVKERLFTQFERDYMGYNDKLSFEENYRKFEEVYRDKIGKIRDNLITEDLKQYNLSLKRLGEYKGLIYYAGYGENVLTNSPNRDKDFFKSYPSYLIFDKTEETVYPKEIKENRYYFWIKPYIDGLTQESNALYIAFTDEFLSPRIEGWENNKAFITNSIYQIIGFIGGLGLAFIYLLIIIGRKSFGDKDVRLNFVDKLYNDFNIVMCISLIFLWFVSMSFILFQNGISQAVFPITFSIGTLGLILVLSLVKHIKSGTLIKHSFIYTIFRKLFNFIKEIYDSGSIGMKVALIVIGYPAIVAVTFFIFPITIGAAVWLAFKKVKDYKAIKEGVEKVKKGDLHHKINVTGKGELAKLADDINSITDGLNKAVANELRSGRLKTELITNVSHDIRTPLTSIITYVDLLKNEKDRTKTEGYINIIDQKAQRLKILTDDLFEASKASSGNIPVNYEKIEVIALITQGLGELDDKVQEAKLEFRINHPKEKVYIKADGKLLWRAIENLLSNIFKYALKGSRVYINIEDLGTEVKLIIKNISAYELNISPDDLMERFTRGDESRSSQGSGLGLSIAKSLIEIQKGSFNIEIDGDLFKVIIRIPK
ncbi:MAG: histidine kinase [Clostridiaceae bacterium BRH_c20a]|nr:MAG: histidine kinase [Clostridiaceae bacterium BRH_c20a]